MLINFYPGPAKIYKDVATFAQEALQTGVASLPHRSPEFMEIVKNTVRLLKDKLRIPDNYGVFFTSSATETWEIIAQSLIREQSLHVFNGSFGEKWQQYTEKIGRKTQNIALTLEQEITVEKIKHYLHPHTEIICLTQNETSNGTQIRQEMLRKIRGAFPEKLIAVDVTSSLAGIFIDFEAIDVAFASVQKCLGLPAGMAIVVCSPKAIEKAQEIGENKHYNSLTLMIEKMHDWQTTYTPNILNIFLLYKILQKISNINLTDKLIHSRAEKYYQFFDKYPFLEVLINNTNIRSDTVIALKTEPDRIAYIKTQAQKEGFLLGNGYGKWKEDTLRIANFPALEEGEIQKLFTFFEKKLKF